MALTQIVALLIIDEVHLLHSERGPVLESLVARTLRQVEQTQSMIRIVLTLFSIYFVFFVFSLSVFHNLNWWASCYLLPVLSVAYCDAVQECDAIGLNSCKQLATQDKIY